MRNSLCKGENWDHKHFLTFPKCFQKATSLLSFEIRDCLLNRLILYHTNPTFNDPEKEDF